MQIFLTDAHARYDLRPVGPEEEESYELACLQGLAEEVPTHVAIGWNVRAELAVRLTVTGRVQRHVPGSGSLGFRAAFQLIEVPGQDEGETVRGWLLTAR